MRRLVALWCALTMILGASLAVQVSTPAQAEPECRQLDPFSGQCMIYVPPPPPDYPVLPREGPGDPGDPGDPVCADPLLEDRVVPCFVGTWYWSYSWACWTKYAEPQPPWSDPVWSGRTDGAIFWCSRGVTLTDPFPPRTASPGGLRRHPGVRRPTLKNSPTQRWSR